MKKNHHYFIIVGKEAYKYEVLNMSIRFTTWMFLSSLLPVDMHIVDASNMTVSYTLVTAVDNVLLSGVIIL